MLRPEGRCGIVLEQPPEKRQPAGEARRRNDDEKRIGFWIYTVTNRDAIGVQVRRYGLL
jgi:hypothetical protein